MATQNHFYIISYDLDTHYDSSKSKRLIELLRKYHAICLTKSTWLLCSPSNCYSVYCAVAKAIGIFNPDSLFGIGLLSYDDDRLFVAEITGKVFGEYLICDEEDSRLTLEQLIEISKSSLIEDGFKTIFGA